MEKKWIRMPFDIELAKKIQSGEVEGRFCVRGEFFDILDDIQIELPEEAPICNNPDSPRCKVCSNWHCNDCQYNTPKHEFKPFDKVLVRVTKESVWIPRLFSVYYNDAYITQDGKRYDFCIPYEGNEHLIGTTDKPKEE